MEQQQQQPTTELRTRMRRLGVPILIGFFLVVYAAFGVIWYQQGGEQQELNEEIANLQRTISRPVVISGELKKNSEQAQDAIPGELTAEDMFLVVLGMAEDSGFDTTVDGSDTGGVSENRLVSIFAGPVRAETVGQGSYQVLPLSIEVTGGYSQVLDFIASLGSQSILETLVLEAISISQTEEGATASLEFAVYTR